MITIDEVNEILNELVDELPQEIFTDLTGGISLLPEEKLNPLAKNGDLFILGEYSVHGLIRTVIIYYGSFAATLGESPIDRWQEQLRHVLRHEFLHHVESLAGQNGLARWDYVQMERYLKGLSLEKEDWENV